VDARGRSGRVVGLVGRDRLGDHRHEIFQNLGKRTSRVVSAYRQEELSRPFLVTGVAVKPS